MGHSCNLQASCTVVDTRIAFAIVEARRGDPTQQWGVFVFAPSGVCDVVRKGNCERERRERLRDLKAAGGGAVSLFSYLR